MQQNEAFDPQAFLNMTTTDASVKRPPLTIGDYVGVIGEPTIRDWVSPKDPTKAGKAVDFMISLEVPPEEQARIGIDKSTLDIKDGFILDLTPAMGLDMAVGKNGGLRRYRDATGLNVPGQPFNIMMLQGKVIRVKIGHREYPEGSQEFFEDIKGVAKN